MTAFPFFLLGQGFLGKRREKTHETKIHSLGQETEKREKKGNGKTKGKQSTSWFVAAVVLGNVSRVTAVHVLLQLVLILLILIFAGVVSRHAVHGVAHGAH